MSVRVFVVFFLTLCLAEGKIFVPFEGPIKMATNLPASSIQLQTVKAIFEAAGSVQVYEVPKGVNFCKHLAVKMKKGVFVSISDNAFELCQLSLSVPHIQILSGDQHVAVAYKHHGRFLSTKRVRFEPQILAQLIKSVFFDYISDEYLNHGHVTFKDVTIKYRRFFSLVDVEACFLVVFGLALGYLVQILLRGDTHRLTLMERLREVKAAAVKPRTFVSRTSVVPVPADEFRLWMNLLVEFLTDLKEHPENYVTAMTPGFLVDTLPKKMPERSQQFEGVLRDLFADVLPKLIVDEQNVKLINKTSDPFPKVAIDTLSSGLSALGLSCTSANRELEHIVINWFGRAFAFPESFLFPLGSDTSLSGGGFVHKTTLQSVLAIINAAKQRTTSDDRYKFVAYCSSESDGLYDKLTSTCGVVTKRIGMRDDLSMKPEELEFEIRKDLDSGNRPLLVVATVGPFVVDSLSQVTQVAKKYNVWVHVDAAYSGSFFVLPESTQHLEGLEDADSIDVYLHKLSVSLLFTRQLALVNTALSCAPLNSEFEKLTTDDQKWVSLKVFLSVKVQGLNAFRWSVENVMKSCEKMRLLIENDARLELVCRQCFGIVTFRVKDEDLEASNKRTKELLHYINNTIHFGSKSAKFNAFNVIRISLTTANIKRADIDKIAYTFGLLIDNFFSPKRGPLTPSDGTSSAVRSMTRFDVTGQSPAASNVGQSPAASVGREFEDSGVKKDQ